MGKAKSTIDKAQTIALKSVQDYRTFTGNGDLNRDTSKLGAVKGLDNHGKWDDAQDAILVKGVKVGTPMRVLAMQVKHSEPCTWARARRVLKVWYGEGKNAARRAMTPKEKEEWKAHCATIREGKVIALKAITPKTAKPKKNAKK